MWEWSVELRKTIGSGMNRVRVNRIALNLTERDRETCRSRQQRLLKQAADCSYSTGLPQCIENVRCVLQNATVGKEEKPVTAFQFRAGVDERPHPLGIRGYGQHPKTIETKTGAMNGLRPGSFVGQKFSVERGLEKILPHDRHRPPIGFEEKQRAVVLTVAAFEFQREHTIRDDAKLEPAVHVHSPTKRLTLSSGARRTRKLPFGEKANAVSSA